MAGLDHEQVPLPYIHIGGIKHNIFSNSHSYPTTNYNRNVTKPLKIVTNRKGAMGGNILYSAGSTDSVHFWFEMSN